MARRNSPRKQPGTRPSSAGGGKYICPMCEGVASDEPGVSEVRHGVGTEPATAPAARTVYTCPMHPEIEQDRPGTCPKCGMALEPSAAARPREEDDPELRRMTRRFWVGLALGLPVFLLAMSAMVGVPLDRWMTPTAFRWLQLALSTPVVLWAGWPFFQRGWRSIVTWNLNMFTLIALGTGAAYCYSVAAVLLPGVFPESFRQHGQVAVYFEAAAMITVLVLLGQVLELRARRRTGRRDPRAAVARAADGPRRPRRRRGRRAAGRGPAGRPAARPARREDPGRRRGHRGPRARSTSR